MKFVNTYFTTVTVNNWVPVFYDHRDTNFIIYESLDFLSEKMGVTVYGFVIMKDHLHIIWKTHSLDIKMLVTKFTKYTGRTVIKYLKEFDPDYLQYFNSVRKDREFKFWKQKSWNFKIINEYQFKQKLNYIHKNPTVGNYKCVTNEEKYDFSSAYSYKIGISEFGFLEVVDL